MDFARLLIVPGDINILNISMALSNTKEIDSDVFVCLTSVT
jgi:hypothetical protein